MYYTELSRALIPNVKDDTTNEYVDQNVLRLIPSILLKNKNHISVWFTASLTPILQKSSEVTYVGFYYYISTTKIEMLVASSPSCSVCPCALQKYIQSF